MGVLLFALAVTAPLLVFWLTDGLQHKQLERIISEMSSEEQRAREPEPARTPAMPASDFYLTDAVIVPGQGIGDIRLGLPLAEVRAHMPAETVSWFEPVDDGTDQVHAFAVGAATLSVRSRASDGLVMAVTLAMEGCALQRPGQVPQDGLPRMRDGLSVGSHISRVFLRLGAPDYGAAAPALAPNATNAVEVRYPGLSLSYCPQSMIVREVTVHPGGAPSDPAGAMVSIDRSLIVPDRALSAPGAMREAHQALAPVRPDALQLDLDIAALGAAHEAGAAPAPTRDAPRLQAGELVDATLPTRDRPAAIGRPDRQQHLANLRPVTIVPEDVAARVAILVDRADGQDRQAGALAERAAPRKGVAPDRAAQDTVRRADAGRLALAMPRVRDGAEAAADSDLPHAADTLPGGDLAAPQPLDGAVTLADAGTAKPDATALQPQRSAPPATTPGAVEDEPAISYKAPAGPAEAPRLVAELPAIDERAAIQQLPLDLLIAAGPAAETDLDLSDHQRRLIQRQLRIVGFNPSGIDGVFGPKTREAIAAFQADQGLPPTGFVDARLWRRIDEQSKIALAEAQRARRAAKRAEGPATVARVPEGRNAPQCHRDANGTIVANQSWSCDVSHLGESLRSLFGDSN